MEEKQPGDPQPQWGPGHAQPQWGQAGYGAGPGALASLPHPARIEPAAVGAMVLAVFSFFVPVVILAVVALILARVAGRRIRRAGGALRGVRLATAAKVVGTIGLLFNLAVIVIAVLGGFEVSWSVGDSGSTISSPGAATATTVAPGTGTADAGTADTGTATTLTPVEPGATTSAGVPTSVLSLQVGNCVRDTVPAQAVTVDVVDCAAPHAAEVFANVDVPAGAYPGEAQLDAIVEQRCLEEAFFNFVGASYDSSVFYVEYLLPTAETWAQGDHVITCMLVTADGSPLTGSMRGATR